MGPGVISATTVSANRGGAGPARAVQAARGETPGDLLGSYPGLAAALSASLIVAAPSLPSNVEPISGDLRV